MTPVRGALVALALFAMGCGAKTGLLIPDADLEPDAGMDAGVDAGTDAGIDAGMCLPRPVVLTRRGAQVLFVIDRSNSMRDTIEGEMRTDPDDPRPSRWDVLAGVLRDVLTPEDPLLEVGAEFYPTNMPLDMTSAGEACRVDTGIDLRPGPDNVERLLRFFVETQPLGGTPTAVALDEARAFLASTPSFVPRFVVLATDGGPNCNLDLGIPPTECVCTGQPASCTMAMNPDIGRANCLDRDRTLGVVTEIFEGLDVPVYVIGMDDPMRPDLADVLDAMAIAGGRPRDEDLGGRRFYSIRRLDDLEGALTTITDSIAQCVFTVAPRPGGADELDVRIDGVGIPRDRSRSEGWDYTREDRGELTVFGGACERVTRTDGEVDVMITCPPE